MGYFESVGDGYDRAMEGRLEEEKKSSKVKTILKLGTLGGRIKLNGHTKHLYIPMNPSKMSGLMKPNLAGLRERTKIRVRGFR